VTNNNPTKRCSSLGARSRLTHSSSVASRLAEALGASVEAAEGDGASSVTTSGGVPSGATAPDPLDSAIWVCAQRFHGTTNTTVWWCDSALCCWL